MEHLSSRPAEDDRIIKELRKEIDAAKYEPQAEDPKAAAELKSFAEEKAKEILNYFEPTRANEVVMSIRQCLYGYFQHKCEIRAEELEHSKRLLEQFNNN